MQLKSHCKTSHKGPPLAGWGARIVGAPQIDPPTSTQNLVGATGTGSPTVTPDRLAAPDAVPRKVEVPFSAAMWWLWDRR